MISIEQKKEYVNRVKEIILDDESDYFDTPPSYPKEDVFEVIDMFFLGKKVYEVSVFKIKSKVTQKKVTRYKFSEQSLKKIKQLYKQYGDLL